MNDKPNEKVQIDRSGLTVNTDPQAEAERAAKRAKEDTSGQAPSKGVTQVGGGDHGKTNKGVRIVKR